MGRISAVRRTVLAGVLAAIAITACDDDDATGPNDEIVASIQTDAQIMGAKHESNLGEIRAGVVAAQKAANAEVRAFAQMMIAEHTVLDAQGTALAIQLGIAPTLPDDRLPQTQAQELQLLNTTAAGAQFDRVYIAQQITAHERTLELVDAGIQRTTRAEIRALLQQARPNIVEHLELARDIQGDVGRP